MSLIHMKCLRHEDVNVMSGDISHTQLVLQAIFFNVEANI